MWDLEGDNEVMTLPVQLQPLTEVAVTPDGKKAVSSGDALRLWDLENGEEMMTREPPLYRVSAVAVTPDRKQVVSGSVDGTLKVWEPGAGKNWRLSRARRRLRAALSDWAS